MQFDPDQMIAAATAAAGSADFNGDGWRTGFVRLLSELNAQPLHADGRRLIAASIHRALVSRLQIEGWYADHPQIAEQEVVAPVIIFGLPRTASSALQNILSVDPAWRFLRQWEAEEPVPPPVLAEEPNDPRYLREKAFVERDATFKGLHIQAAGGPVEDGALARLDFGGQEQGWPVFAYTAWWREQSKLAMLHYIKRALKLLQSRRPPTRWLLKTPWYAFCMEELRAVFPDARFVMTHRNPRRIIPSTASLHFTSYARFMAPEDIDKPALGRQALEHWTVGMDRALDYRQSHPHDEVFDVHHGAFNADPLGTVRALYAWLGMDLSPAAERGMAEWAHHNRRGAHGTHSYDTADYGVTDQAIDAAFARYNAAFAEPA